MNATKLIGSVIAVVLASSFALPSASADIMTYNGIALGETVRMHAPGINLLTSAGQVCVEYQDMTFAGYTVEIDQDPATCEVTRVPVDVLKNADLVSYLYETYHPTADTSVKAAALQVAVWEVLFESDKNKIDAGSGKFLISENNTVRKMANDMLSTLPSNYQPSYPQYVLASPVNQDILVGSSVGRASGGGASGGGAAVPEPTGLAMLGLGGVLMLIRRRRLAAC